MPFLSKDAAAALGLVWHRGMQVPKAGFIGPIKQKRVRATQPAKFRRVLKACKKEGYTRIGRKIAGGQRCAKYPTAAARMAARKARAKPLTRAQKDARNLKAQARRAKTRALHNAMKRVERGLFNA